MCSHIRAALLLTLSVPLFFGLSCTRHSRPQSAAFRLVPPVASPRPIPLPAKPLPPVAFPFLNTGEISSLAFSPDGRRLAFGYGQDAEVTLWNLQTGRLAWQRSVDAASGGPIQFDPRGRFLVAQLDDPDNDAPTIVSTLGGRMIRSLFSSQEADPARLEKAGRFLVVSGLQEGVVNGSRQRNAVPATEVWNTRTWRRTDRIPRSLSGKVPLTSVGKIILPPTPKPRQNRDSLPKQLLAERPYSNSYTLTTNRQLIRISGTGFDSGNPDVVQKGRVEVWDLDRRTRIWKLALPDDSPRALAVSPNGRVLVVATLGGVVYFWNLKTGRLLAKTRCATDVLRCVAFSPNGRVLAAAGGMAYGNGGSGVRLLDTANYQVFAVLKAAFPQAEDENRKDWSEEHPDWLAVLPDLSYLAPVGVVGKIRTPGQARATKMVARFGRSAQVRAALRKCWQPRRQRTAMLSSRLTGLARPSKMGGSTE